MSVCAREEWYVLCTACAAFRSMPVQRSDPCLCMSMSCVPRKEVCASLACVCVCVLQRATHDVYKKIRFQALDTKERIESW